MYENAIIIGERRSSSDSHPVEIEKYDEVYIKIKADPGIMMEISDHFTFDVPGAKFTPAYKSKFWDGKIRLFQVMTGYIYAGLNKYVEEFCKSREYELEYISDFSSEEFSLKEAKEFAEFQRLQKKFQGKSVFNA